MARGRVTKEELRSLAESMGITQISPESFEPVYNPNDRDLTVALWKAAVSVARAFGKSKLVREHSTAAWRSYNLMADELDKDCSKRLTKKSMRDSALAESVNIKKVSPAAIDVLFVKEDPVATLARWAVALSLASDPSLKETQTVQVVYGELANEMYGLFKNVITISDGTENSEELREETNEHESSEPMEVDK